MGRWLTQKDMSSAKYSTEAFNSALKRGEIKRADDILATRHVVCGCGAEGCIFISVTRKDEDASHEINTNAVTLL